MKLSKNKPSFFFFLKKNPPFSGYHSTPRGRWGEISTKCKGQPDGEVEFFLFSGGKGEKRGGVYFAHGRINYKRAKAGLSGAMDGTFFLKFHSARLSNRAICDIQTKIDK